MIYGHDCDTQLPHNLFDEEFGPDTKVLPPSRPNAEPTPISYMISKVKLCLELGSILQATGRVRDHVHYDEILRFDAKLRGIKAELPPHLRLQPLEGTHDPLTLVIARFNLDILYLKIMCLLHRKYLPRARHNLRYAHSRRSAIESSLEALRHLATLHRESQPNGRLRSIKWFVTSIATRDFLLPAMLVVLDLHFDNVAEKAGERRDSHNLHFWTREQRREMISSLELTRDIWKGLADSPNTSMEAVKASNILDIMLEKIKKPSAGSGTINRRDGGDAGLFGGASAGTGDLRPEHSAAVTLGMLSGGLSPGSDALQSSLGPVAPPTFEVGFGSSGSGSGSGMTPDFSGDLPGLDPGPASPFSVFNSMANANMDFTNNNFDWVCGHSCHLIPLLRLQLVTAADTSTVILQDSFENYAQTAHFGETLQFFSGNTDLPQQPGAPDGNPFAFGDLSGPS